MSSRLDASRWHSTLKRMASWRGWGLGNPCILSTLLAHHIQCPIHAPGCMNPGGERRRRLTGGLLGFDPLPVIPVRLQQLDTQSQPIAALDSPDCQEVANTLRLLGQKGQELKAVWEQRQQWLQEGLELQRFGREVDGFTATCANHEAWLHLDNLGEDVRGTLSLLQQHRESEQLLSSLGPRAEALQAHGEKLVQGQHPAAHRVREQLQSVQAQWTRLQTRSEQRKRQLLASLQLQEWKRDVAELMQWMEEKGLLAAHEPSGAPRNILQTLKRHKAAECELLATRRHVEALQQFSLLPTNFMLAHPLHMQESEESPPTRSWGYMNCFHPGSLWNAAVATASPPLPPRSSLLWPLVIPAAQPNSLAFVSTPGWERAVE
ncbi:hypothetical protein P7K49_017609 [Saguinus oedipus]|uniref:Uncharacterized protein n=1 Tax=Saguinus oedipus TaxID=9490 RepID=A0ABQ9V302_SAGOE|nr:hypothetical protein P7K49_017609 [Saguinus oedipus]